MAMKKITKRWLFNNLGVILVILIAIEIGFAVSIRAFYYNNVQSKVMAQADIVSANLLSYSQDSSTDYSSQVRNLVEGFEKREQMELMALDMDGNVVFTSSGFQPRNNLPMPDFESVLAGGENLYIGDVGDEHVMAVTVLSPVADRQFAAVRFAVSLEEVDKQVLLFILMLTLICIAIISFVVFTSSYFINSIVRPVGEIGQSARRIAQGDFSVRLRKLKNDEIGELCDTINDMAEELSVSEKMQNDFISSISHELRTPLTAIKGWSETISDFDEIDQETFSKGMRVITSETERLAQMVEELLDFSRIQDKRMQLNKTKIDLIAELSEVVLMYEETAKKAGKTLHYHEPDHVVPFFGDRNRLRQVFINVIDNALKYSDAGDSVTVRAAMTPGHVCITVTDTGLGIKSEDLPRIKERFFKANSTRRGSGIGLAVADEIIAMHDGTLEITSKEQVGTRVTILLPLSHS